MSTLVRRGACLCVQGLSSPLSGWHHYWVRVRVRGLERRFHDGPPVPEPVVLSGSDLDFRVQGMYGEVPMGKIVIRVNGAWIDAQLGSGPPNAIQGPPPPPVAPVPPPVVPSPR